MLAGTAIAVLGLPLIASALVVYDLLRAKRRLPSLRVYLFLLQYMTNDSIEIIVAPIYWAMAGFGTRLGSGTSIARHERLQWWSLNLLERRSEQLLGLTLELDAKAIASDLTPGPVIVISRHVSLFDASLPGVVCERAGFRARGVIMAELLADPGFDLIYGRLGSIFIPRDDAPAAVGAIEKMTRSSEARASETAYIIFPEGRLFRPSVRDRALARLAETSPERALRLEGLTNMLPPRPAGLATLLNALPTADVVLLQHDGLDGFQGLKDLAAAVPVDDSITMSTTRIARSEIPNPSDEAGLANFTEWLDELWLGLDADLSTRSADTNTRR